MKHMKKAFSLIMALVMVICLAVPAFAASTDEATVTVYVTTGMFTEGGYDPDHGTFKTQEFKDSENLDKHLFDGMEPLVLDAATVSALLFSEDGYVGIREVYSAPATLSSDVNVLDAIICALQLNGYECEGGWDSVSTYPGGYVHSVTPNGIPTGGSTKATIDGVEYTKYYGTGWRIAIGQNDEFTTPSKYGTSFPIQDGMIIVFDLSSYVIYA